MTIPRLITATATAVAAGALLAGPAYGGASGCARSDEPYQSCVEISGGGTLVESARGIMKLQPRSSVRGHLWLSLNNRIVQTGPTQLFKNSNWTTYKAWRIHGFGNVRLRDGDKICGGFRAESARSYAGGACKRIKG